MVKCPFCNFENEDGALFCEQCKSDLGAAVPAAAEEVPMAAVLEEPVQASALPAAEPIPMAAVQESAPMAAVIESPPPAPPPAPPEPKLAPTPPQADATPPAEPAPAPEAAPEAAAPAPAPAAPSAPAAAALPPDAKPKLVVLRGQRINIEYPLYEGLNFIGRADEKPVDIDLDDQEPPDKVWCSRQHALINFENGSLTIEDLNSANGTYVNRTKVYPGQKRQLNINDVIQIGTVHMKLKL
jgi:outer membrane biosynthesis protein TonB